MRVKLTKACLSLYVCRAVGAAAQASATQAQAADGDNTKAQEQAPRYWPAASKLKSELHATKLKSKLHAPGLPPSLAA